MPYNVPTVYMRLVNGVYRSWPAAPSSMIADAGILQLNPQLATVKPDRRIIASPNNVLATAMNTVLRYSGNPTGNWQLAEGHYEPRVRNMRAVCPRPDSETGVVPGEKIARAWHNIAKPGIKYKRPIGIAFGSWPNKFELMNGPSGMYVGEHFGDIDYGSVVWPSPVQGSFAVKIRVYDQQYQRSSNSSAYVDIDYTINSHDDIWIELKKDTPISTFADIHKNSTTDNTYTNKAVMIRGGVYTFSCPSGNELSINNKPKIWSVHPDEASTIDFTAGRFFVGGNAQVWFDFDNCINSCQALQDSHFVFFQGSSVQNRCGFTWKTMSNLRRGSAASDNVDNPAAVCIFSTGTTPRQDFYMGGGSITNFSIPAIDCYTTAGLIENIYGYDNVYDPVGDGHLIFPKGGNDGLCVRRIKCRNIRGHNAIFLLGATNGSTQRNIEVSWCDLRMIDSNFVSINTNNAGAAGVNDGPRNLWIFRNTCYGLIDQWKDYINNIFLTNNVIVSNTNFSNGTPVINSEGNRVVTASGNVSGNTSAGILDANNLLTGINRQLYLGIAGAEVA